jgi:hypothetical protein
MGTFFFWGVVRAGGREGGGGREEGRTKGVY